MELLRSTSPASTRSSSSSRFANSVSSPSTFRRAGHRFSLDLVARSLSKRNGTRRSAARAGSSQKVTGRSWMRDRGPAARRSTIRRRRSRRRRRDRSRSPIDRSLCRTRSMTDAMGGQRRTASFCRSPRSVRRATSSSRCGSSGGIRHASADRDELFHVLLDLAKDPLVEATKPSSSSVASRSTATIAASSSADEDVAVPDDSNVDPRLEGGDPLPARLSAGPGGGFGREGRRQAGPLRPSSRATMWTTSSRYSRAN